VGNRFVIWGVGSANGHYMGREVFDWLLVCWWCIYGKYWLWGGWAALMDTIWRGRGMVAVDIVGVVW